MNDNFNQGEKPDKKLSRLRTERLADGLWFDPKKYEFKEDWRPARSDIEVHSTEELIESLKRNPKNQIEAKIICQGKGGHYGFKTMGREAFLEFAGRRDSSRIREAASKFKEFDEFGFNGGASEVIGKSDYTPLLGGPFAKQLYYRDYLRMISACFYAYHHDPAAKAVVSILIDFTMGRGFQLHADDKRAQVIWNAFVEANNFHEQMDQYALELSVQGEHMWWWLPSNYTRIAFNPDWENGGVPRGIIPRIRLLDPSNIAEITTIPEDIVQGVLFYTWLAPTQYQMYTDGKQPSSKFIYTQIPANQIMHFKVNGFSNEKRGRSDFFPALGYMKRLRDGVNYALVAQQKAAAWCVDTTIEGDAADIDQYISDQKSLENHNGIQTAGSEFVHTPAIKREYLANSATSKGGDSPVFSWCLNMIAMASGIPVSYLGTHLSGGSTRASALVSTEPVTKRFERRQLVMERTVRAIFTRLCRTYGIINTKCEIIFPELLTQDRSSLFKDLTLAQTNDWIAPSRAAEIANKELDSKDFNYEAEMAEIIKQKNQLGIPLSAASPLTAPGQAGEDTGKPGQVTSEERVGIKDDLRQ